MEKQRAMEKPRAMEMVDAAPGFRCSAKTASRRVEEDGRSFMPDEAFVGRSSVPAKTGRNRTVV